MKTEDPILKNIVFISFSAHLLFFGIFSFSFGRKPPSLGYAGISFWGAFLRQADFAGYSLTKHALSLANQPDTAVL